MQQGSYVVCINDSNWDPSAFKMLSSLPKKGNIYRIRRVIPNFDKGGTEDGVALEGIYGQWNIYHTCFNTYIYEEYHFYMSRFKEIDAPELFVEAVLEKIKEEVLETV